MIHFRHTLMRCPRVDSEAPFSFSQKVDGEWKFLLSNCGGCHQPLFPQIEQLSNQFTRQLQKLQDDSEKIMYICQSCDNRMADILCNVHEEEIPTCAACGEDNLRLHAQAFQSYAQLRYWGFMFDLEYLIEKIPELGEEHLTDPVKIFINRFKAKIDEALCRNGFTNFSLRNYMEKLPSCAFTKRAIVSPDFDIP